MGKGREGKVRIDISGKDQGAFSARKRHFIQGERMKIIHHQIHGHDAHDLSIYLTQRMIVESGADLLDGSWFSKRKNYPGIPDIYCRVKERRHNGSSVVHGLKDYVIEIESKLSKANREKKEAQFQQSNAGTTELIIINLADLSYQAHDSISALESVIRSQLIFVE
jgi:Uma2 family endonuclease